MPIDDRIPDMSDAELSNLQGNALRLKETGAPPMRVEAERILPIVAAALERRRIARNASIQKQKLERREAATAKRRRRAAEAKVEAG